MREADRYHKSVDGILGRKPIVWIVRGGKSVTVNISSPSRLVVMDAKKYICTFLPECPWTVTQMCTVIDIQRKASHEPLGGLDSNFYGEYLLLC